MTTTKGTIPDAPVFPLTKVFGNNYTKFFSWKKDKETFSLLDEVQMVVVGEPYATP
jgi:hypothetical protein